VIEEWRRPYNFVRPHSSLNNMTPEHFCRQYDKNLNRGETLKNRVVLSFPAGHAFVSTAVLRILNNIAAD